MKFLKGVPVILLFSICIISFNIKTDNANRVIIYKTRKNYSNNIPIVLSQDKRQIISFPSPSDIKTILKPKKLKKGYFLDNFGISRNTVFISLSYSEYSKLKQLPNEADFKKMIIDSFPFLEMYDCGDRYQFEKTERQINKIIKENKLSQFTKIL